MGKKAMHYIGLVFIGYIETVRIIFPYSLLATSKMNFAIRGPRARRSRGELRI